MRLNSIDMFVCTELIEETGRPPGLIFWDVGIFLVWLGQAELQMGQWVRWVTFLDGSMGYDPSIVF